MLAKETSPDFDPVKFKFVQLASGKAAFEIGVVKVVQDSIANHTGASAMEWQRAMRKSSQASIPVPDRAETSRTVMPGRTSWMLFNAASRSNSAASDRSHLVMTATSAVLKMVGYFNGL